MDELVGFDPLDRLEEQAGDDRLNLDPGAIVGCLDDKALVFPVGWNETSSGKNENRLLVVPSSNVATTSGMGSNMPSGMGRGIGEMMALMIFMEWFVLVSWGRWKEVGRH